VGILYNMSTPEEKMRNFVDRDVFSHLRNTFSDRSVATKRREYYTDIQWANLLRARMEKYKECCVIPGFDDPDVMRRRIQTTGALEFEDGIPLWTEVIMRGLCRDDEFQRLVIDDRLEPDYIKFDKVEIDEAWLSGLFLPGYYHFFDNLDNAIIKKSCCREAIQMTKKKLQSELAGLTQKGLEGLL